MIANLDGPLFIYNFLGIKIDYTMLIA